MRISRRRLLTGAVIAGSGAAAAGLPQLLRPPPAFAVGGLTTAQWIAPSGDTTGAADTANIQAQLNAGGAVWLAAGQFYVNATLAFKVANTAFYGQGRRATKLTLTSAFSGSHAIDMANFSFSEVRDLSIEAPVGSLGSSTQCDGIRMSGGIRCRVANVYCLNLNGWAYLFDGSAGNCAGLIVEHLLADTCAGAISLTGPDTGYRGSAVVIAPSGVNMGTGAGPCALLPLFFFVDFEDLTFFGHPAVTPVNGGGAMVIEGNCASLYFYGCDMGGTTTKPAVLIEDGISGSPQNIGFYGGILQSGSIGAQVTLGANKIFFDGVEFARNMTHGLSIEGTGTNIVVSRCFFSSNGAGAQGTNYDLNWSSAATGDVANNHFNSAIVTSGAGVRYSVNNASSPVKFELNAFTSTSSNYTNSPPAHVLAVP